jgi:hypothetical protein
MAAGMAAPSPCQPQQRHSGSELAFEEAEWHRRHQPLSHGGRDDTGGTPSRLFTDEDPATTIKGMGFRDARAAELTIKLSGQPGAAYKQYWTVKAMAERARHHPHRSVGMDAALAVFDRWLAARHATSVAGRPAPPPVERAQRRLLAESAANAHARSRCESDAQHNALLAADRRSAVASIRGAARGTPFGLAATAFVSVFGAPGEHGYGQHRCEDAVAAGLAAWRCVCGFAHVHTVSVSSAASLTGHSSSSSMAAFKLRFDGGTQRATLLGVPARGQSALTRFFRPVPRPRDEPPPTRPAASINHNKRARVERLKR